MHPGSLCLLGAPCAPRCCDPGAPSVAVCSGDTSSAFGLCLPSCHQGTLWLLDDGQGGHGHAWSCEPSACTMSWDPQTCCAPGRCPAPAGGTACSAWGTPNAGPGPGPCPGRRPSCRPCTWTQGRAPHGPTCSPCAPAAGRTLGVGPPRLARLGCFPGSALPLPPCRRGGPWGRSCGNPGSIPGFAPSHCVASSCQSRNCVLRDGPWPRLRPASCPPLSCVSRNIRPLSHLPGTFPPLRYLRSGCRA
uniref:Keratin associated protein 24-1 n=1 Tax=Myotis myotis TaxID=51298 RepID=A0A7J7ZWU7_MYOMY|nr:keratin associated protein 24-1 [Myotis myotis]